MAQTWDIVGYRTVEGVSTLTTIATVHELEYHGEWMSDEYVTLSVKSPTPIDFHFGDYLVYRDEEFVLNYDPNVVKKARRGTYGEGFTYDNIKLYTLSSAMKKVDMKDVVLDEQQTYSMLSEFSFFAGSVEDLADRLQANLNRESADWRVFTPNSSRCAQRFTDTSDWSDYYDGNESTGETDVNINVTSEQTCWDMMSHVYSSFGLNYYFVGKDIIIGGKAISASHIFRYGKDLGLYEIERTSEEDQSVITKLFSYGSSTNLPTNYYANSCNKYKAKVVGVVSQESRQYLINIPNSSTYFTDRVGNYNSWYVNISSYNDDPHWQNKLPAYISEFINQTPAPEGQAYLVLENYASVSRYLLVGEYVYFNWGINKSNWPTDSEHIDSLANYPALLSVNKLMLPGFPIESLKAWICDKAGIEDSSVINSEGPNTETEVPTTTGTEEEWRVLLRKYGFSTDSQDPWIKSGNYDTIGLLEGSVNYDGSQQKEIYPTINNTNAGVVTQPSVITDNGFVTDPDPFEIQVAKDALDWNEALATAQSKDDVAISMTSGYCIGRDFKVVSAELNVTEDAWILTLERQQDSSLNRYFPYHDSYISGYCQIRVDDTFAAIGIEMPDEYIVAAAEKMLIAACGYLDKYDHTRYTYLPKVDEIYMAREHDEATQGTSLHDTLHAGQLMQFEDAADLGIERLGSAAPFIDVLTIKENGNNGIPTYDVVLRDEKDKGTLEKLTESIADLKNNPTIKVVERAQRTLQYVEYTEWVSGDSYYHEAINELTDVLETSMVWHRGCLWMCMQTYTDDEPWFSSSEWTCVRAANISLGFFSDGDNPIPIQMLSVRPASVDETVKPYLLLSQEDISSTVTAWVWTRDSGNTELDAAWNALAKARVRTLNITNNDLPSSWYANGGKIAFTCTATIPFGAGETAEIINQITII